MSRYQIVAFDDADVVDDDERDAEEAETEEQELSAPPAPDPSEAG